MPALREPFLSSSRYRSRTRLLSPLWYNLFVPPRHKAGLSFVCPSAPTRRPSPRGGPRHHEREISRQHLFPKNFPTSLDLITRVALAGFMDGKFIAYYRVSTDHQGVNGNGMAAQRKAVEDYLNGGR